MVEAALADDVAWTRLLQEIATVLPNDVWLTAFTGQKAAARPGPGGVGTINVTGQGFDQSSAARWLLRVGELQSLTGLWLPSSTEVAARARARRSPSRRPQTSRPRRSRATIDATGTSAVAR